MSSIREFIKRNASLILHIFVTLVICIFFNIFFERIPDYLLFGNLALSLIGVYLLYRIIFKKVYADSFLKLMCILSIVISANQFYSYNKLETVFPWLVNVNRNWLIVGLTALLISILLVFKLLTYLEPSNNQKSINNLNNMNSNVSTTSKNDFPTSRNELFSFLRFFGVITALSVMILIPALLLYFFNKYDLDKSALDFDKVFSFLLSYGSSFLLILFAIVITIITLIYIMKFICNQIRSFKISNENESYTVPTYAISVIIVCILLFLSWRITDFSLDDLTQTLAIGDYLALPLAVIVIMILFFLLVQIVHAVFLMLSKVSAADIKDFFKKQEEKLRIGSRVVEIIESIVNIVLDTILSTLTFIKFIPSFFTSLSNMVLLDDYGEENQDVDEDEETSDTEKDATATDENPD